MSVNLYGVSDNYFESRNNVYYIPYEVDGVKQNTKASNTDPVDAHHELFKDRDEQSELERDPL